MKVIYIAGYGRSGSTILEMLLSRLPGAVPTGELRFLFDAWENPDKKCSCGAVVAQCPFWKQVMERLASRTTWSPAQWSALLNRIESRKLVPYNSPRTNRIYAQRMNKIFDCIRDLNAEPDAILIDSSKTARKTCRRPMALKELATQDLLMLHIVRDPRGCLWSNLKGSNQNLERGIAGPKRWALWRTCYSWRLANRYAEAFGRRYPRRYLRIRYEDLATDPDSEFERIISALPWEVSIPDHRPPESVLHQVAGNRVRSSRELTIRLDEEWKEKLPENSSRLCAFLCGRLMKKYGY